VAAARNRLIRAENKSENSKSPPKKVWGYRDTASERSVSKSLVKRAGNSPHTELEDGFMRPKGIGIEHVLPIRIKGVAGSVPTGPS